MAYVGHQHVIGFGGLYTSVSIRDEFSTKVLKGLPNYTVVAGKTKLATLDIEGVVTDTTTLSGVSHSDYTTAEYAGAGAGVDGVLTKLTIAGKAQNEVTFSATVQGAKTTGASSTSTPGAIVFCEDASIKFGSTEISKLSFNLSLSWGVEFVYDAESSSYPYPDVDNTIFKSFEGTLTVSANELGSLGNSLGSVNFTIVVGNLSITGTAYETTQETADEADGTLETTRTFTVATVSISEVQP